MRLSRRTRGLKPSETLRIAARAAALRADGVDVIDFSAGQPDFPTEEVAKEAGVAAIRENRTGYTPNPGIPELRRAIAEKTTADQGFAVSPDRVLVSTGAKASLFFALQALLEPGDVVVIVAPYWVSYPRQIELAGGTVRVVETDVERGFAPDPDRLREALVGARALILNEPSNPTGATFDEETTRALGEAVAESGVAVILDEIYAELRFDGRGPGGFARHVPALRERALIVDGMSKTYAMTGWRIGWAAGPKPWIEGMARWQSHATSNATSISQWASLAALRSPGDERRRRRDAFRERRDRIVEAVRAIPGWRTNVPGGAFYLFPRVAAWFGADSPTGRLDDAEAVCDFLLEHAHLACVPGDAFGAPEHVRFSYALSTDRLDEGMRRLAAAAETLSGVRA